MMRQTGLREETYQGGGKLEARNALITGGILESEEQRRSTYAREGANVAIQYYPGKDAKEVKGLSKGGSLTTYAVQRMRRQRL